MLVGTVVALALFAGAVTAQTNATYIDPTSVNDTTKASWCNGQQHVCTVLCVSGTTNNTCFPTTLEYSCLCSSNNSAPDLAAYRTSLPSFVCQQSYADCILLNPNDQEGQDNCTTNIENQCGTLDIANFTAPASSSSASATASPTASSAGTASGTASTSAASTSPTKNAAAAAMIVGREYGSGLFAALCVAAFGFMV